MSQVGAPLRGKEATRHCSGVTSGNGHERTPPRARPLGLRGTAATLAVITLQHSGCAVTPRQWGRAGDGAGSGALPRPSSFPRLLRSAGGLALFEVPAGRPEGSGQAGLCLRHRSSSRHVAAEPDGTWVCWCGSVPVTRTRESGRVPRLTHTHLLLLPRKTPELLTVRSGPSATTSCGCAPPTPRRNLSLGPRRPHRGEVCQAVSNLGSGATLPRLNVDSAADRPRAPKSTLQARFLRCDEGGTRSRHQQDEREDHGGGSRGPGVRVSV